MLFPLKQQSPASVGGGTFTSPGDYLKPRERRWKVRRELLFRMTVILKFFPDAVFLNRRGGGLAEYPSGCRLFRKSRLSETRSHRGSGIRAGHAGDVPVLSAGGGWKASACEDISQEAGQGCFGGKPGEGDDGGSFPRFFVQRRALSAEAELCLSFPPRKVFQEHVDRAVLQENPADMARGLRAAGSDDRLYEECGGFTFSCEEAFRLSEQEGSRRRGTGRALIRARETGADDSEKQGTAAPRVEGAGPPDDFIKA